MRRRDRLYAWTRRHPLAPDAALAGFLFLIVVLPTAVGYPQGGAQAVLGTVFSVALVFRRVRPVASFAVVGTAAFVQWATDLFLSPADLLLLVSFYSISGYGPRWASRAGLGAGLLGAVLAGVRYMNPENDADAVLISIVAFSAMVIGAWALGDLRRVRQAYVAELVNRVQQAERERDQRARIAAADERARIAREMHDVVAHSLSVIVAQADGGRYAADQDPVAAAKALDTIGEAGRGALADMRRLLGVLRTEDGSDGRNPQPGLALLPELVASVRNAGLAVDFDVTGSERTLRPGASLAVYRALQEALTNTLKHAGPSAHARVRLTYDADRLTAEVSDDGRGAAASSDETGFGLRGMRERVEASGGDAVAGPGPGGGWRVRVEMPYGEEE